MTGAPDRRWMLCRCLGETYAVDLRHAREIIYRPRLVAPPGLEPPLCGLIMWRGRPRLVVGLRLLAGDSRPAEQPVVIIVGDGLQEAGLLADGIGETVAAPELFPLHPALRRGREYIAQAFMAQGSAAFVIDVAALLAGLAPLAAGAEGAVPEEPSGGNQGLPRTASAGAGA